MNNDYKKISLELAKKLYELGVRIESEWYWTKAQDWGMFQHFVLRDTAHSKYCVKRISAYDVAELGKILSSITNDDWENEEKQIGGLFPIFNNGIWGNDMIAFRCRFLTIPKIQSNNEAKARCKILIYLIEYGHIKIEDINNANNL
ncbi:hypothetical protein LCGC14_2916370 [marine sediment metagenome]|uniref:Uncharacterized protein n=1 Tax=marine sediment metagenome TaxID=412755 RepID=A0A0F8YBY2_9ZZZZ